MTILLSKNAFKTGAKTLIVPGMRGTPERKLFERLPMTEQNILAERMEALLIGVTKPAQKIGDCYSGFTTTAYHKLFRSIKTCSNMISVFRVGDRILSD